MRISASQLDRLFACAGSAVLPQVRTETEYARRGTAIHAFLARVPIVGRDAALTEVPDEYRPFAEAIPLEHLPVDAAHFAAEIAFAYDVVTDRARELGRDIGRDYNGIGPTEIPGTVDIGGLGAVWYACEIKTGRTWSEWQLRFAALAGCRAYGRDAAICDVMFLREDGSVGHLRRTYDVFDLVEFRERLLALHHRLTEAEGEYLDSRRVDVAPGEWCHYCPAYSSCDAQVGLVRQIATAPATFEDTIRSLVPHDAGKAWEMVIRGQQALARARAALEGYVREHGRVPLPSGGVVTVVETKRETVTDGKATFDTLRGLFDENLAQAACKITSSKEGIERALRPKAKELGVPLAKLQREVLDALRQAGALETKAGSRVDEVADEAKKGAA